MDLSTSCPIHYHVTLNARMTLNAIRMDYFWLYAHCWSQLDPGFGLLSSCPICGIRRISMDMPTITTFQSVTDDLTMTWRQLVL